MKLASFLTLAALLPGLAFAAQDGGDAYRLDTGQVFTLFFITLGPLKLLGPFAASTRALSVGELRGLAWKATMISLLALVGGGLLGVQLMGSWTIPRGAMQLAAGVVFFLVALKAVLAPYDSAPAPPPAAGPVRPMQVAFPMLVTPYGIAAVIVLLAVAHDMRRTLSTLAVLLLVVALNLLGMVFVRTIMRPAFVAVLQVLGAVLGLLQVALSLYIMLGALNLLGILSISL